MRQPAASRWAALLTWTAIAAAACGRGGDSGTTPPAAQTPPAKPPAASTSSAPAGTKPAPIVEPIDPELLKAVLPEVIGWTRSTPRGGVLASPAPFSKAEARYDRVPATVHVEVQDTALNQVLLSGMAMFLTAGYEERSADGYKRSGTYKGHPGFEEWKRDVRRGEINILVGKRFIVSAIGQRLDSIELMKQLIEGLHLDALKN